MRRLLLVALCAVLPLTAACDPKDQEPSVKIKSVVVAKQRPCGNNGKCQSGETKCWRLQLRDSQNRVSFRCVSQLDWDAHKVGQKYP